MFCTACGEPVGESDRFCPSCGASLGAWPAEGATVPPSPDVKTSGDFPNGESLLSPRKPRKAVIALVAAGLVLAAVAVGVGAAILLPSNSSEPAEVPLADGGGDGPVQSATIGSSDSTQDDGGVPVRSGLSAYSWEELATLAEQMEQASSVREGTEVAVKYHLLQSSGSMVGGVKALKISDGTVVEMQLVGVLHDEKADGTGKASLTFMTTGSYADHAMNTTATNTGGWSASDMRSWLNSSVLAQFPSELRDRVVPVRKLANNIGRSEHADCVSATSDSLWLFSWTEMFGTITWNKNAETSYIDLILNKEGTQYRYFKDEGLADSQDSDIKGVLKKYRIGDGERTLSSWWTRSPAPNRIDGFGDVNNGGLDNGGLATSAQGVVFGFCL